MNNDNLKKADELLNTINQHYVEMNDSIESEFSALSVQCFQMVIVLMEMLYNTKQL